MTSVSFLLKEQQPEYYCNTLINSSFICIKDDGIGPDVFRQLPVILKNTEAA